MIRRGIIGPWEQRKFIGINMGDYNDAQGSGNVPDNGKGEIYQYFPNLRGEGRDEEGTLTELVYASPVLENNGQLYRFYQQMVLLMQYVYEEDEDGNIELVDQYATGIWTHFGIVLCGRDARLNDSVSGGSSTWNSLVASSGSSYLGRSLYSNLLSSGDFDNIWRMWQTQTPTPNAIVMDMITGSQAENYYNAAMSTSYPNQGAYQTVRTRYGSNLYQYPALFIFDNTSTSDIVDRAMSLSNYKYWYGGNGQIATLALANSLRNGQYTRSVWTQAYYDEAILDINGSNRVGDCSYLVCYAYNIPRIGSSQIRNTFIEWTGTPLNGMILWRPGHVAIYSNGNAVQLRGLSTDFQVIPVTIDRYDVTLYDPDLNY